MNHTHTNETVTELTETYVYCGSKWNFLGSVAYSHNRCDRFNKENIFPEDSLDMGFVVREPIINETFGDIRFRRFVGLMYLICTTARLIFYAICCRF